jgi:tetratricopeptide (TPR) repeat protein
MKRIFLLAFFAAVAGAAYASEPPLGLFNEANTLYAKGQYAQAASAYEALASSGEANAELYYNLGNAYYKTQRYGRAVLSMERAARLDPRDPDIRFNLGFLKTFVKEPGEPFPEIILTSLNGLCTLNELAAACSALLFIFCGSVMLYTALKRQSFLMLTLASACLLVVFSGWFVLKVNAEVWTREAIVVSGPADVRNGPGAENSVGFSLPEGRKVEVLGGNDGWAAIGLRSEGLKGWIEKQYLEEI